MGTGDAAGVDRGRTNREIAFLLLLAVTIVGTNVVGAAHITNRTDDYVRKIEVYAVTSSSMYPLNIELKC